MLNKTEKVVLFCIPHAGGNSSSFNKWRGYMPDNIIFKPIELSGRGKRLNEKLDASFEDMIDDVFNSIKKIMVNFDMDYYIFGHSMGAWIVLELLYYFKEYHLPYPKGVIFSGNIPPCFYHKSTPPLHLLPDKIFLEEVSKLGRIPGKIIKEKQFVEYFVPIIKNDFKLIENYYFQQKQEKFPVKSLICSGKDDKFRVKDLVQWENYFIDKCSISLFKGGHFYIDDNIASLCNQIKDFIYM